MTNKTTQTESTIPSGAEQFNNLVSTMLANQQMLQQQLLAAQQESTHHQVRAATAESARKVAETQAVTAQTAANIAEAARKAAEASAAATKTEAEAATKTANDKVEELKKSGVVDPKSPGRRIVDRIGESAAGRLADTLEKNKVEEIQEALQKESEALARILADNKKAEGKVSEYYHVDKSVMHWSLAGSVVLVGVAVAGTGYYCYNKGREAGHNDAMGVENVTYSARR